MEIAKRMLFEAAAEGRVSSLQQLLIDDPMILDSVSNSETALHVAARLGHTDFVKKIIEIKPDLTNKLNSQGSSPLHLASTEGHVEVARALLLVNNQMCSARDINGFPPIHLAVVGGCDEVIKLLLVADLEAARLILYGGESIFHLCVKHNQIESLKLLLRVVHGHEMVNYKDDYGNTALHLAVANKQVEMVELLLSMAEATLKVSAQNLDGFTAMDVLIFNDWKMQDFERIKESFKRVGGLESWEIKLDNWIDKDLKMILYPGLLFAFITFVIGFLKCSLYMCLFIVTFYIFREIKRSKDRSDQEISPGKSNRNNLELKKIDESKMGKHTGEGICTIGQ